MKIEVLFISLLICAATHAKDHENLFNEELVVKELSDGFISSYFQFTTRWNIEKPDDRKILVLLRKNTHWLSIIVLHTDLLSRSISDLFLQYDIIEIRTSLSNGLWRHEHWGFPVESAGIQGTNQVIGKCE